MCEPDVPVKGQDVEEMPEPNENVLWSQLLDEKHTCIWPTFISLLASKILKRL